LKIVGIENRKYPRRDIDLVVNIVAHDGATIRCWLSDISQGGARLATSQAREVPDEFMLELANDLRRWSRVVWRTNEAAGLQFIPEPDSYGQSIEPTARSTETAQIGHSVMITCGTTGRPLSTGVHVSSNTALQRLPKARRFVRCPHCGTVHSWDVRKAWVPANSTPKRRSTRRTARGS
jgi:hypothetical protein